MSQIPVVIHHQPDPLPHQLRAVNELAERLQVEQPALAGDDMFRDLMPERLDDIPTLHLDELGEIQLLDPARDISFQQERARLRAGDGDFVVGCVAASEGYEDYCRERLGLGSVAWLRPRCTGDARRVSEACWLDEDIRRQLVEACRNGALAAIHPHLGSLPVWQLAKLLSVEAGCPLKVIAPPPAVTKFVNDKLAMADVVRRLFGPEFIPRTERAANLAKAAEYVSQLAGECSMVTVKLPDSVGGAGNIQIDAAECRDRPLLEIHSHLKQLFDKFTWNGESELLIGCWETEVCLAPSAQLWIPPVADGPPVVEGLFEQQFDEDHRGKFVGSVPADLPPDVEREIVNRSWLLALLFQQLGYVGRCSFDMLLIGQTAETSRLKFLECNGRWGGASLPMTLMNRLFGDWKARPYAVRDIRVEGLDRMSFRQLTDILGAELFDRRSGSGRLALINPARMQARSAITVLALGSSWQNAAETLKDDVPQRLQQAVEQLKAAGAEA